MRWSALVGYTLFVVVMFLVGLVVTFPIEQASERLAARVAAETGWDITVKGAGIKLPATIHFDRLAGEAPDGPAVVMDDVAVRIDPMRLKDKVLSLDHEAKGYGGSFTGHLDVEGPQDEPGYQWQGKLARIDLARLPLPPSKAPWAEGLTLTGAVSADGNAGWRADQILRGNGELDVAIDGVVVNAPKTPMGEMSLPVGEVNGRLKWQRGRVDVTDLVIEGDLISARGSGRIMVGATPQQTRLDLRLTGELGSGFPMRDLVVGVLQTKGKPVTITLKGNMGTPILYINGKTLNRLMLGR